MGKISLVDLPLFLQEPLRKLAAHRSQESRETPWNTPLFTVRSRDTGYKWVRKICAEAGIPPCCPHALRAKGESDLASLGHFSQKLAEHYGHSQQMARRHYLADGAEAEGTQRRRLEVLAGGKK